MYTSQIIALFFAATAAVAHPAATTAVLSVSSGTDWINQCLLPQNKARTAVKVAGLTWDAGLATSALVWSKHLAEIQHVDHSIGSPNGENVFSTTFQTTTYCADAVKRFLSQKGSTQYNQVVWKNTKKVGCALFQKYVTCHYYPPGNIAGQNPF